MDEVHARRLRAPPRASRLGPPRRSRDARGGLVERLPRDAVLSPRGTALGVVLSGHGTDSGVPGALALWRGSDPLAPLSCTLQARSRQRSCADGEAASGSKLQAQEARRISWPLASVTCDHCATWRLRFCASCRTTCSLTLVTIRIRAGRVYPITAPSIDDGAVLVDAHGRIAAVGRNAHVPTPTGIQAFHFPDAGLMPGLINCHTHLELTHLGGGAKHAEPEFLKWIRRIRELKDATSADAFHEAAIAGIRDCWARGITCIAETGSTGAVMRALHDLG
ncbi:MAG: hypothetical protein DMD54_03820, partial [Gemmatimonadetes bacterium]